MLRQARILPPGVSRWSGPVLGAGNGLYCYCSTISICFCCLKTFRPVKLIPAHSRVITALDWSIRDTDLIVTTGNDQFIRVWSVKGEKAIARAVLKSYPVCVAWNPANGIIAVGTNNFRVRLWDYKDGASKVAFTHDKSHPSAIRWNPSVSGLLAIGMENGELHLYSESKSTVRLGGKASEAAGLQRKVVGLEWDPASTSILLVGHKNGDIALWDSESASKITDFIGQTPGLRSLLWVPNQPGVFLTVSSRTSQVAVWNASQPEKLHSFPAGPGTAGILAVVLVEGTSTAICSFVDGSVGVLDLSVQELAFKGPPSHSETVFDCKFRPGSPSCFASAGFDGMPKLWDVSTEQCRELEGVDKIIYSLSWEPCRDGHIAGSTSEGNMVIWDACSAAVVRQCPLHRGPLYRLEWNPNNLEMIATGGADGRALIVTPLGEILREFGHPDGVCGVMWHPRREMEFATACVDGDVRVFSIADKTEDPRFVLKGHSKRAFNVVWHPLVDNVLASASDDCTVRVWHLSTEKTTSHVLRGHTKNVRALVWSPECPALLLSGSWDHTIRVWDTLSVRCLQILEVHQADVYALAVHPKRPFLFVSSSRDTTLRFWVMEGLVKKMRMQAIATCSLDELIASSPTSSDVVPTEKSSSDPDHPVRKEHMLFGAASKRLASMLSGMPLLDRFQRLFDLFEDSSGLVDLWPLMRRYLATHNGKRWSPVPTPSPPPPDSDPIPPNCLPPPGCLVTERADHLSLDELDHHVIHTDFVPEVYNTASTLVAKVQLKGVEHAHHRSLVDRICAGYLKAGDFERYCELQIRENRWLDALRVARRVSYNFWKAKMGDYGRLLSEKGDPSCIPFLLASGSVAECLLYLDLHKNMDMAGLLLQVGGLLLREQQESIAKKKGEHEPIPGLGDSTVEQAAAKAFSVGASLKAACLCLSMNKYHRALHVLMKSNRVEVAFALCKVFPTPVRNIIEVEFARRCVVAGALETGLGIIRTCKNASFETLKLLVFGSTFSSISPSLWTSLALRSPKSFMDTGTDFAHRKLHAEAVKCFAAGGSPLDACISAVKALNAIFSQPTWDISQALPIVEVLHCLDLSHVTPSLKGEVIALCAVFGLQKAMFHEYDRIVPLLAQCYRNICSKHHLKLPVSVVTLQLLEAFYFRLKDPVHSLCIVRAVESRFGAHAEDLGCADQLRAARRLRNCLEGDVDSLGRPDTAPARLEGPTSASQVEYCSPWPSNAVKTVRCSPWKQPDIPSRLIPGASLPRPQSILGPAPVSVVDKKVIQDRYILLEDKLSAMSVGDAALWCSVMPFSPLGTGARIPEEW